MNIWSNAVITTAGLNLLAKLMQGNSLDITRAVTGAGFVTPGLLQSQTSVSDVKQTLVFTAIEYPEDGKCALTCRLDNTSIEIGYTAMQVGIYATDPDDGEILFFIAQAAENTGTPIPSKTEMGNYTAEWTFYFQYGQADSVNVTVDPAGAVSRRQLDAALRELEDDLRMTPITNEEIDELLAIYDLVPAETQAGGTGVYLTDMSTGNNYVVYVYDGDLKMAESE